MKNLESLYIGGGTPSLWGTEGAQFLGELFERLSINLDDAGEFTLEVNPGAYTREAIQKWKDLGVNRFSLGIQSLRADYLKILDRVHSVEEVMDTLKFFKESKFNFSVDFMLGLPWSRDKKRNIIEELKEILDFNPDHISLYILTAKASYPHRDHLPQEDFLEEEYLSVAEHLKAKGYLHYEVSNFSKPSKESRHNLKYWQGESVAAIGPSGSGFLKESKLRYKWKTSQASFQEECLSEESLALEKLYLGLRLKTGIILSEHFSEKDQSKLTPLFLRWQQEDLCRFKESQDHLALTSRGLLVLEGLLSQIFSVQEAK